MMIGIFPLLLESTVDLSTLESKSCNHVCKSIFICRAGWMMGGGKDKDKKFIKKIMDQILAGQDTLYIVNDKLGTLLYI